MSCSISIMYATRWRCTGARAVRTREAGRLIGVRAARVEWRIRWSQRRRAPAGRPTVYTKNYYYYYFHYNSLFALAFTCVFSSKIKYTYTWYLHYVGSFEMWTIQCFASDFQYHLILRHTCVYFFSWQYNVFKLLRVPPWYHKSRRGANKISRVNCVCGINLSSD